MKVLKNNLKTIIAFIIGAILTGGIVYATVNASGVNYSTEKNAEIENVEQALNDLYNKTNSTNVKKYKKDTFTFSGSKVSVTVGFQPSEIFVYGMTGTAHVMDRIYNTSSCDHIFGSAVNNGGYKDTTGYCFEITSNGFDINSYDTGTYTYVAIK